LHAAGLIEFGVINMPIDNLQSVSLASIVCTWSSKTAPAHLCFKFRVPYHRWWRQGVARWGL